MSSVITVLLVVVSILLILVVLVQNSKGGGLAAGGAANQVMGVKKTADFLEKTTWTLAIVLISLSLITKFTDVKNTGAVESADTELREKIDNAPTAEPIKNMPPAGNNPSPAPAPAPAK
jgi:preprotein translocase subunit SecG